MVTNRKANEKTRIPLVICVCGMAGSGKSTVAKRLAEKYKLQYFSGGDALKALALSEGYANVDRGWWEREEGKQFLERRTKDQSFDSEIDKKLLERAQQGGVILDSWTMPWLLKLGFKVWLEASPEKRAERIAERDGMSVEEALSALRIREKQTKDVYKNLYGFRLGEDHEPFHLILDTERLDAGAVFQVLCVVIDSYVRYW